MEIRLLFYKDKIVSTIVNERTFGICFFNTNAKTDKLWACRNLELKGNDSVLIAYSEKDPRLLDIYKTKPSIEEFDYCNVFNGRSLSDSTFVDKKMHTRKKVGSTTLIKYYPRSQRGSFIDEKPMDENFTFVSIETVK